MLSMIDKQPLSSILPLLTPFQNFISKSAGHFLNSMLNWFFCRKGNARFQPKATVEILKNPIVPVNDLDEEGKRELIRKYLGVSLLLVGEHPYNRPNCPLRPSHLHLFYTLSVRTYSFARQRLSLRYIPCPSVTIHVYVSDFHPFSILLFGHVYSVICAFVTFPGWKLAICKQKYVYCLRTRLDNPTYLEYTWINTPIGVGAMEV